jgi:hypothetical protein
MTCGAQGVFTRMAVEPGDSPYTFDEDSEIYFFDVNSMRKQQKRVMQSDNTGSRSLLSLQHRQGPYLAGGEVRMRMNPTYLDRWMPRVLGGAKDVNDIILPTEGLNTNGSFGVLVDKVAQTEEFRDCRVNRAVLAGRAANADDSDTEPVSLVTQIYGRVHAVGTPFPNDATHGEGPEFLPYIFEEGTFRINDQYRAIYAFQLAFDNRIIPRFANELYVIDLCPKGRITLLTLDFKFDSVAAGPPPGNVNGLFEYPDAGYGGATLTFTAGPLSVEFWFNRLEAINEGPTINGQNEVVYRMQFLALKQGSDPEVRITNVSSV